MDGMGYVKKNVREVNVPEIMLLCKAWDCIKTEQVPE
jgi:hypothetical protein